MMEVNGKALGELTFLEARTELERIVNVLESNTLELEDSLKEYERGVALLALLHGKLDDAEQKITVLMGELEKPREAF